MLTINIAGREVYDERTNTFTTFKPTTLRLEHSLISISKWESKWHAAFLGLDEKTPEQELSYVQCMIVDQNVDPSIVYAMSASDFEAIRAYINDPMTGTTFKKDQQRGKNGIITSEVIYYWMFSNDIPIECEKWHLNRLLTLIRVCSIKSSPGKKMKKKDIMAQNRALNASRKARAGGHR